MTEPRRRAVLTTLASATVGLGGCVQDRTGGTGNETGTNTGTPEEHTVDGFVAALESAGIRVDSTMSSLGGVSVMYYHDPENHTGQLNILARTFVDHRRIINSDALLAFTALSSTTDRHGEGHISREWADRRSRGDLSDSEYTANVRDTYRTL